jgi:uncharacterized protein YigE (DUF2233 family)
MLRKIFILHFILVSLLWASLSYAADWSALSSGLLYKNVQISLNESVVSLKALKIDPSQYTIKPVISEISSSVQKMAQKTGALAVINANFFDTEGNVLGLVRKDNKNINNLKKISWWSVFCLKKSQAKIVHTTQYSDAFCEQAVQAGPRLVVDGVMPKLKDELSRKTVVGIDRQGYIVFVVSKQEIPIKLLAEVMTLPEKKGGFDCPNAINMDGGGSAQIYIKDAPVESNLPSFVEVPVGLGVFKK